jgi:hypothetical protein
VITPGLNHQSTASQDRDEQGSGLNRRGRSVAMIAARSPRGRGAQDRAALTIARMPALIASGSSGHTATISASSGVGSRHL